MAASSFASASRRRSSSTTFAGAFATNPSLEVLDRAGDPSGSARLMAAGAELLIPLAGVLDPDTARTRLQKRMAAVGADAAKVQAKLANERFTTGAPPEVVDKERARLVALQDESATLESQLAELG